MEKILLLTAANFRGDYQRKQEPLEVSISSPPKQNTVGYRKVIGGYGAYSARPKFHSIRPIVDRFFSFHEDETLGERYVKVGGKTKTYKQLFKGIFNQNLEDIDDTYFIYWGLAFINRTKNNDSFQIRFTGNFLHDEKGIRPSIFVKDTFLEGYQCNKRLRQYLNQENVDGNVQFFAFIYGFPELVQRANSTYINFELTNLDYLDFKEYVIF